MTGGANLTRLIYPYVSSSHSRLTGMMVRLKLDRLRLAPTIYDVGLVFVCSPLARIEKDESGILVNTMSFLITAGEVTASQEEPCDRRRFEFSRTGVGASPSDWLHGRRKRSGEVRRGEEEEKNQTLNTIVRP